MNRIINYIKENAVGSTIMAAVFIAIMVMATMGGCNLSDIVKVNVPPAVREVTNTRAQVTLSRAPFVRDQYITQVTGALDEFDASIEQASVFRDFAASLLNTGIGAGQGALAGVPGGALLIGALGGLGGLFLKKPGTDALVNKEKMDSYRAGYKSAGTAVKVGNVNA